MRGVLGQLGAAPGVFGPFDAAPGLFGLSGAARGVLGCPARRNEHPPGSVSGLALLLPRPHAFTPAAPIHPSYPRGECTYEG